MNPQYVVMLVCCYGNRFMVDNYLFTHCIYDISECKIKILDPKNVENDILHATFGHVVMSYSRCLSVAMATVC